MAPHKQGRVCFLCCTPTPGADQVCVCLLTAAPCFPAASRSLTQELIKFAYDEKIVLLADEVYQENIYQDERPFVSARKVRRGLILISMCRCCCVESITCVLLQFVRKSRWRRGGGAICMSVGGTGASYACRHRRWEGRLLEERIGHGSLSTTWPTHTSACDAGSSRLLYVYAVPPV
jgi:hypothetical protein